MKARLTLDINDKDSIEHFKDYASKAKDLQVCFRLRDNEDIYTTPEIEAKVDEVKIVKTECNTIYES